MLANCAIRGRILKWAFTHALGFLDFRFILHVPRDDKVNIVVARYAANSGTHLRETTVAFGQSFAKLLFEGTFEFPSHELMKIQIKRLD
jgi:hypothetical protein